MGNILLQSVHREFLPSTLVSTIKDDEEVNEPDVKRLKRENGKKRKKPETESESSGNESNAEDDVSDDDGASNMEPNKKQFELESLPDFQLEDGDSLEFLISGKTCFVNAKRYLTIQNQITARKLIKFAKLMRIPKSLETGTKIKQLNDNIWFMVICAMYMVSQDKEESEVVALILGLGSAKCKKFKKFLTCVRLDMQTMDEKNRQFWYKHARSIINEKMESLRKSELEIAVATEVGKADESIISVEVDKPLLDAENTETNKDVDPKKALEEVFPTPPAANHESLSENEDEATETATQAARAVSTVSSPQRHLRTLNGVGGLQAQEIFKETLFILGSVNERLLKSGRFVNTQRPSGSDITFGILANSQIPETYDIVFYSQLYSRFTSKGEDQIFSDVTGFFPGFKQKLAPIYRQFNLLLTDLANSNPEIRGMVLSFAISFVEDRAAFRPSEENSETFGVILHPGRLEEYTLFLFEKLMEYLKNEKKMSVTSSRVLNFADFKTTRDDYSEQQRLLLHMLIYMVVEFRIPLLEKYTSLINFISDSTEGIVGLDYFKSIAKFIERQLFELRMNREYRLIQALSAQAIEFLDRHVLIMKSMNSEENSETFL